MKRHLKRYIPPSIYVVEIDTSIIANWGSMQFGKDPTNSYEPTRNGLTVGDNTDSFDAPSYRSSWDDYEK